MNIPRTLKALKTPFFISLGVAGVILTINSISAVLPVWLSTLYQFILGIILIGVAGYFVVRKKK